MPHSKFIISFIMIGTVGAGEIFTPHAFHTQLGSINPHSGMGTNIGSFDQPEGVRLASGAFDNDGQFYSIALFPGNTDSQLARVNTSSGAATLIGEPTGEFVVPLEVSDDGTMYTVGYYWPEVIGDNTNLFTVSKTDGQLTPVGATHVTRAMDLAFDSQGTLWLVSGGDIGNNLYTLNQATGEETFVSTITGVEEATEPGAEIMGIMFDEHDTLFATAHYGANADFVSPLFNLDPASGVATVIGNTGFVNPHGGDYSSLPPGILGNPGLNGFIPPALRRMVFRPDRTCPCPNPRPQYYHFWAAASFASCHAVIACEHTGPTRLNARANRTADCGGWAVLEHSIRFFCHALHVVLVCLAKGEQWILAWHSLQPKGDE